MQKPGLCNQPNFLTPPINALHNHKKAFQPSRQSLPNVTSPLKFQQRQTKSSQRKQLLGAWTEGVSCGYTRTIMFVSVSWSDVGSFGSGA
jgi:hypothetical protein